MIITHPTGSYDTVLPTVPSDSTSVVYTISDTTPPRFNLNFTQIPFGIQDKQFPARTLPDAMRRDNLGALVFTTKDNKPGIIETGNQLFYAGQVIEFSDSEVVAITDINSAIQTSHDQQYTDPSSVGLNSDEMDDITASAIAAQKQILLDLGTLQKRKDDLQVDMVSQQKIINEANRIIGGLDAILAVDPTKQEIIDIRAQLQVEQQAAQAAINADIVELNTMPAAVGAKHDQLRALAVLID